MIDISLFNSVYRGITVRNKDIEREREREIFIVVGAVDATEPYRS